MIRTSVKRLTLSEERELAKRIKAGDRNAKDEFCLANMGLVGEMAKKFSGRGIDFDDLSSAGTVGLLRACEEFDPEIFDVKFSTYATYWVRMSILEEIYNTKDTVRIPKYLSKIRGQFRQRQNEMRQELGREPKDEEVSQALGISPAQQKVVEKSFKTTTIGDYWQWSCYETPWDEILERCDLPVYLTRMSRLKDKEVAILNHRFGLRNETPKTLAEVATLIGVSKERVRQIQVQALERIAS